MKPFVSNQKLLYVGQGGPELVEYQYYVEKLGSHVVTYKIGDKHFWRRATDDELFALDRSGIQCFVDAEIERRHAAALADMAAGNPTATHLVRTFEAIAQ